jgi:hypothetical protein
MHGQYQFNFAHAAISRADSKRSRLSVSTWSAMAESLPYLPHNARGLANATKFTRSATAAWRTLTLCSLAL